MKAPFQTEEEVNYNLNQHANAGKFKLSDDLARYSSVSAEGFATRRSIDHHAENIDPYVSGVAYAGLSMPSTAGFASAKVGKRKSRAIRKPPIKVFSADSSNFMAMVHRLTGFDQSSAYLLAGSPNASMPKPFVAGTAFTSFMQGVYVPEPPAGNSRTKSFLNDTYSHALSQRIPSLSGRKQLDLIDDAGLSTTEGLPSTFSSPSGTGRHLVYDHHPLFKEVHGQVSTDSNINWDSCGVVFNLPDEEDSKEDCRKEEICLSLLKEQRRLHEDVGAVRH